MGNATSKAAKSVTKLSPTKAARKYPPSSFNRTNAPTEQSSPGVIRGPTVHPKTQISSEHDQTINRDASDPDLELSRRARGLGPVDPNPTLSNSSTFNEAHGVSRGTQQNIFPSPDARANPALNLLAARERLAAEAEEEFGNLGRRDVTDRRFLDVYTLRQVLQMRERGMGEGEIEEKLGLKRGSVGVLGGREVFGTTMVA